MEASNAATLTLAEQMIAANEGESLMPRYSTPTHGLVLVSSACAQVAELSPGSACRRASFYAPITARRFQSLAGRLGDDDMFRYDTVHLCSTLRSFHASSPEVVRSFVLCRTPPCHGTGS
jgi:hypothetical protein